MTQALHHKVLPIWWDRIYGPNKPFEGHPSTFPSALIFLLEVLDGRTECDRSTCSAFSELTYLMTLFSDCNLNGALEGPK